MKKYMVWLFVVILLLSVTGCKKKESEKEETVVETNAIESVEPTVYYAPLTGKIVQEEVDQRVVAVMINNHTKARPQSGISQADMVYELLAEGDITRLLAIFQSTLPDQMGPVRSARDYYMKIAEGYNGFYICHGQSPSARELMNTGVVDALNGINYDGVYFHRDQTRVAPHNSYITKSDIQNATEKLNIQMVDRVQSNVYSEEGITTNAAVTDGQKVKLKYSGNDNYNVMYQYDETKNGYVRSQGGVNTTDRENGETVVVQNVFIVKAEHRIIDNYGRRSIDLQSGGQGYLLQKGKMLEVTWTNEDGRLVPMKDGNVVPYIPGQTWMNVVENRENTIAFDI